MNFKEIKKSARKSLEKRYFKFFLLSFIAFVMSIELIIDLSGIPHDITGIVKISYIAVLIGALIKPYYLVKIKGKYLEKKTEDLKLSYKKITLAFFIRRVIVFVSLFAFVIPGIYKALEYMFLPYILADKKDISLKEAFLKASLLTKGKKLMLFKFVISFAPLYILGFLFFIVGVTLVNPYFEMSLKEVYLWMKESESK